MSSQTGSSCVEVKLSESEAPTGEMAQRGVQLDRETVSCSICMDLLKDPVTIPCGHSYCLVCIQSCWAGEVVSRCPQCRKRFTLRPVLVKNTMLAAVVEEVKQSSLQAAPAAPCYAGPGDVACDVCTGRKGKACKSCLTCLVSYCEEHLQPHYSVAAWKKHQLVDPCSGLQEKICTRHDELMKIFCRTDQQCICYLCTMDEHKGHDTVSVAAERTERQKELQGRRGGIQQRIQEREEEVKLLQQEVEAINGSADQSVQESERMLEELILLLQRRRSEVKQQIRRQQEAEVRRVGELEEKLQQEICELKRSDAELQQLALTHDHIHFLHNYPSVSAGSQSTASSSIHGRPCRYFEEVTAAVSQLRDKLQDVLTHRWTHILETVAEVDVLLSTPEPKTRAEFLRYSQDITLDPNTANQLLLLSNRNRKAARVEKLQSYPDHPERFTGSCQVLSRESLTGRCYWEVEWEGGGIYIAFAYKNISRAGRDIECTFGYNDKSWALFCNLSRFSFHHNSTKTPVSVPPHRPRTLPSRIGVYLDHSAGILSFYRVSDTMALLHTEQTTFTQPLYAGFSMYMFAAAELCALW